MDRRRTGLVRIAVVFRRRAFSARPNTVGTWTVWQVVLLTGASSFIQQIYQAFFLVNCTNLSELVRTGKMDFLLLLPINTRFIVSTAAGGHPVVCQRRVRRVRHVFRGAQTASASDGCAILRLCRAVRRRAAGSLLADVHPGRDQFLDGAGAGHRVGLLQPVQHRADAGRGVSRRIQGGVHLRAAGAAGEQRAGARAGGQTVVAGAWLVLLGLGVVWALVSEWFWRNRCAVTRARALRYV